LQQSALENAIWMCQSCGTLIDRDEHRFTVDILRDWKRRAENNAKAGVGAGTEYRPIADNELRHGLTVGERAILCALKDEFGCEVKTHAKVPAGDGWA
jgi:hypothetical protein